MGAGGNQSQREETGGSCIIKTKIGNAHGILLRTTEDSLETHLGLKSEYSRKCSIVLITNHHVIPNIFVARDCTILNDKEEINLSDKELIKCISCCGFHGILGKHEHLKSESGEGSDCPFHLDFTILFLDNSKYRLTTKILRSLQFSFGYYNIKDITDLLKNNKLECIQRTIDGRIISCDLTLTEKQNKVLYKTIDNQEKEVNQYNTLATFTTKPQPEKIAEGSSGAPIFVCEPQSTSKELVAIHRLTEYIINPNDDGNISQELVVNIHKHTNIFWILQVIAIYQESDWSQKFPLTLHLALIQSVDFSTDLINDSAIMKSLKFILDLLKNNNNTPEDFDESPSLVMGVLAASLRKAIEKGKVAHLFEMIDVIIILVRNFKLSSDGRHFARQLFKDLDDYQTQDDKYSGLLWLIHENYKCLGLEEETDYQQMPYDQHVKTEKSLWHIPSSL